MSSYSYRRVLPNLYYLQFKMKEIHNRKKERMEREKIEQERRDRRERDIMVRREHVRRERERRERRDREQNIIYEEILEQNRLRLSIERIIQNHTYYNEYELFQDEVIPTIITLERFNKFNKIKSTNEDNCIICYTHFEKDEMLTELDCKHCFHTECINKWLLESSNKCPLCNKIYS